MAFTVSPGCGWIVFLNAPEYAFEVFGGEG
jgi:hypothetical protein